MAGVCSLLQAQTTPPTTATDALNPTAPAVPSKEQPPSKLSFILLGEPVRKTYTVVGGSGGIDEVEAKPGEQPPSRVVYKSGEAVSETWLTLNVPSGCAELKNATGAIDLCEYLPPESNKTEARPRAGRLITNVPVVFPGKSQTAFIVKKDPQKNWQQDLGVVSLPDEPDVFPAQSVRILNLSRGEIFIQVGDRQLQLAAGKSAVIPAPDKVIPIIAAVRQGQGFFSAVKTSRKLRSNDRLSLVIYNYDGEKDAKKAAPPVSGVLIAQPVPSA